jgi:hypothetical protein
MEAGERHEGWSRALQQQEPEPEHHGFQPLPSRGAPVSNALIDRLRDDEWK